MTAFLCLDLGGTGTRGGLFDGEGTNWPAPMVLPARSRSGSTARLAPSQMSAPNCPASLVKPKRGHATKAKPLAAALAVPLRPK
jgi:hypothetical protein